MFKQLTVLKCGKFAKIVFMTSLASLACVSISVEAAKAVSKDDLMLCGSTNPTKKDTGLGKDEVGCLPNRRDPLSSCGFNKERSSNGGCLIPPEEDISRDITLFANILITFSQGNVNSFYLNQFVNHIKGLGFTNSHPSSLLFGSDKFLNDFEKYLIEKRLSPNLKSLPKVIERIVMNEGLKSYDIDWERVHNLASLEAQLANLGIYGLPDLVSYSFRKAAKDSGNNEYIQLGYTIELLLRTFEINKITDISEADRRLKAMGATNFELEKVVQDFIKERRLALQKREAVPNIPPTPKSVDSKPIPVKPALTKRERVPLTQRERAALTKRERVPLTQRERAALIQKERRLLQEEKRKRSAVITPTNSPTPNQSNTKFNWLVNPNQFSKKK